MTKAENWRAHQHIPRQPSQSAANSSAEELALLSHQIEDLSTEVKDMKNSVSKVMTKDDMKLFIKTTVEEIMNEISKGIDLQIETKIQDHSKSLNKTIEDLVKRRTVYSELTKKLILYLTYFEELKILCCTKYICSCVCIH